MSYDLYIVRHDPSHKTDEHRIDELMEAPPEADRAFATAATARITALLETHFKDRPTDSVDRPQIFEEDGFVHIALSYAASGRRPLRAMKSFLRAIQAEMNVEIYDPQQDRVIRPAGRNRGVLQRFRVGRGLLKALVPDRGNVN